MPTARYLGKSWPIKVIVDPNVKKMAIHFDTQHIVLVSNVAGEIDYNKALTKFYKQQAKKHIEKRLRHFQPMIRKKVKSFTIESSEKRWGSCNGMGELTFNWKLMMFPEAAIDYVVVHELCHLEHLNHDRSFWRLVGKLSPNYKDIMPILGTTKTRDL
jgi:hypothetical protein